MSDSSNAKGGGVGLASVLGIVFVILKLTGNIDWKWIWVLSPWWISISLVLIILIIAAIVISIMK
jgi:hypothetical protein